MVPPDLPQAFTRGPGTPGPCGRIAPDPIQALRAVRAALRGQGLPFPGLCGQASPLSTAARAVVPLERGLRAHPSGMALAELVERMMHGCEDPCETVQGADGREDRRGLGPLGAPRLDPAARFTGRQARIAQTRGCLMGEQPLTHIVQQRAVETWSKGVEAQGLFPIHTAAHGSSSLAIGASCDVLHHQHERQTPGDHVHGTPLRGRAIGTELIGRACADLRAQLPREVACGKGRPHGGGGRVWMGRERCGA
jgi:hypothetical protein